ncbi:UNVERIFIED_CONTAM: Chitin synthase, class 2 [Siphonaria sp. JEL0065]|nr:Chitin synthase, class 2 [Siphonaria sp. JEL0065]
MDPQPPPRRGTSNAPRRQESVSSGQTGYSQYSQQQYQDPQFQRPRGPPTAPFSAGPPVQQMQFQGPPPQQPYGMGPPPPNSQFSTPPPMGPPGGLPYSDRDGLVQYGQPMGQASFPVPPPQGYAYPPGGTGYGQPLYGPIMVPAGVPPPGMLVDPRLGASINNIQIDQRALTVAQRRTVKKVELTKEGNLVLDIPVPDRVLQLGQFKEGEEFTQMRYTAVTSDPDNFSQDGYVLRQQESKRPTEIFIVVTMYNEGDDLFCKTMLALMKNISYLCKRSRSSTWGENGWQKVVICIVSDGRTKIHPRVLNVLGLMGVFQDGIMKNKVADKDVTAHLFEYTTQLAVDPDMNISGAQQGIVPAQILFCLKEKNAKKINSHRWFFNAFGALLRPNVCVLIDVGTKPTETSLYHLWKAFDKNPQIGGACGEIYAELGYAWSKLLNPLVASQNFEYKMSNILDKPLESSFGFISVLPGAFSAYRYAALQGVPLQQYFKGETMHGGNNIFQANMYLAEDRILCFELVTKAKARWILRYVRAAKAETDVPDTIAEFISQRRRWLNGSFFATLHALINWSLIFRSDHSVFRKIAFSVEFVYNFVNLAFNWFGIANFFLAFYFLMDPSNPVVLNQYDPDTGGIVPNTTPFLALGPTGTCANGQSVAADGRACSFNLNQLLTTLLTDGYVVSMVLLFVTSLGNRPQGSKVTYLIIMILFAIIMLVLLYLGGFSVYAVVKYAQAMLSAKNLDTGVKLDTKNTLQFLFSIGLFRDIVLSLASTYGIYFLCSFLYLEPWHMFTSLLQYLLLLPSYVNILNVYAFCNLHDVSWGTKGDNVQEGDLGVAKTTKDGGKAVAEVEVPSDRNDINTGYDKHIAALKSPRENEKKKRDAKTKQEDYFKNFRTSVIITWLFSNGILIAALTTPWIKNYLYSAMNLHGDSGMSPNSNINPYLKFIFYANLGLATVRFLGSVFYLFTQDQQQIYTSIETPFKLPSATPSNLSRISSWIPSAKQTIARNFFSSSTPKLFQEFASKIQKDGRFVEQAVVEGICRVPNSVESKQRPPFNVATAKLFLHLSALVYEKIEVTECNFIVLAFSGTSPFDLSELLMTALIHKVKPDEKVLPGQVHEAFWNLLDFTTASKQADKPSSKAARTFIHDMDESPLKITEVLHILESKVLPQFDNARKRTNQATTPQPSAYEFHEKGSPFIWFTGHSMGASLATLVLAHLVHTKHSLVSHVKGCYTFGSPKCGDTVFAKAVAKAFVMYRIVNANDVIPSFPIGSSESPSPSVSSDITLQRDSDYKHVGVPVILNYDTPSYTVGTPRDLECIIKNALWFAAVRIPTSIVKLLTGRGTVVGVLQSGWPFPWEHLPGEYEKRLK